MNKQLEVEKIAGDFYTIVERQVFNNGYAGFGIPWDQLPDAERNILINGFTELLTKYKISEQ